MLAKCRPSRMRDHTQTSLRLFVISINLLVGNLVPRACDPRERTRSSGIIRFREESDWPLKWMRSSILARIPGFRQRIIPEPRVPSRGSQARGTRLTSRLSCDLVPRVSPSVLWERPWLRLVTCLPDSGR